MSTPEGLCTKCSATQCCAEHAPERRLKDQTCPQCGKGFRLTWNDYSDTPQTLVLRGCPSGGIYDVSIACPHCDYTEEL